MVIEMKEANQKPSVDEPYEHFFPDEIIIDILTRVPIESLVRFSCVSKQWCHMIFNDSFFTNEHSKRVVKNSNDLGFVLCKSCLLQFKDYYAENGKNDKKKAEPWYTINTKEHLSGNTSTDVLSSCNGLLLISCMTENKKAVFYYVYNPVTHKSAMVPSIPTMDWSGQRLLNLVYDSFLAKFKVVCCGYSKTLGYVSKIITVGVEGDSWRDIVIPEPHRLCEYPAVFANGALHFMLGSMDLENLEHNFFTDPESIGKVLVMDAAKEIFYVIPHPECTSGVYTLLEISGRLSFINHMLNTSLMIWVLEDLEAHKWKMEYLIDISHLGKLPFNGFLEDSYPFAIAIDSKCKIIIKCSDILDNNTIHFFSYDTELKRLDAELSFDSSCTGALSEFALKFYPLKHVKTLLSF